ncbi:hypothetical protein GCK32_011469, partial [Trichostrongylus colubriformis]
MEERSLYDIQCRLNDAGASDLVIDIVTEEPSREIFLKAIHLAKALLLEGNDKVQQSFYNRLRKKDAHELFFKAISQRIQAAQNRLKSDMMSCTENKPKGGESLSENSIIYNFHSFPITIIFFFFLFTFSCDCNDTIRHLRQLTQKKIRVCGSTKGSLGVFGEIGEHNFSLITQTLATLTEFCQGPCHENQNTMAMQENGLNIIISLVLNDIKPLADDHMELALEIKSQASKLLLAIMESRHDSENAERVLQNMDNTDGGPSQLVHALTQAYEMAHSKQYEIVQMRRELLQRANLQDSSTSVVSPLIKTEGVTLPEISVDSSGTVSIHDDSKVYLKYVTDDASTVDPKEVGHNIYILAHQLSRHSPELAQCLNPDDDKKSVQTRNALEFYKRHTAQIEIVRQDRTLERVVFPIHEICSFLTKETKQNVYNNTERDNQLVNKCVHLVAYGSNKGLEDKSWAVRISDGELHYHICYLIICFLGLTVHPMLYCLLLFDIVASEETLRNVISSVTRNWQSIILTGLLALILVYIFSIVGYTFFQKDFALEVDPLDDEPVATVFTKDPTPDTCSADGGCPLPVPIEEKKEDKSDGKLFHDKKIPSCSTLRMCIITTLNWGLRNGGGIGDVLRNIGPDEKLFYYRIIYDLSFYVVLIVITLNLIFGVIIDTFGDLRTEKNDKEDILKNTCFICGLERG